MPRTPTEPTLRPALSRFASISAKLCVAVLAVAAAAHASPAGELDAEVETLAQAAKLSPGQFGVSIIDLETGRELANLNGNEPFIPASNMKLLTSGAALSVLGCGHTYKTEIAVDENGRLIVRGCGDPAFADPGVLELLDPPVTVEGVLAGLADAVVGSGVTRITAVVIDDRVFDRERVHPSWPRDQLNRWYCAEVDGLSFHANVLRVYPSPAPEGPGNAPLIETQPAVPWLDIAVRGRTVSKGQSTAWVARALDDNRFTVMGDVRHRVEIDVALTSPAEVFGRLLAERIAERGVRLARSEAGDPMVRRAGPAEDLTGGTVVAQVVTPLADVVRRCNADSYNLYAEALLKLIGHRVTGEPGSWSNGSAVMRMLLREKLGPTAAAQTAVADGSGMSRDNRVSPVTLTSWLRVVRDDEQIGPCFIASLPVVGEGTLRTRFSSRKPANEVRGKSGTLSGVRCLSGYVTDTDTGRVVAYSVLVNDIQPDQSVRDVRAFHENIVLLVDDWLEAKAAALGG